MSLFLVHKPVGITSFQVVQDFRPKLVALSRTPKRVALSHGGTLDPFAEGLLVLLAGPATRLMDLLHAVPKRYVATVRWGVETHSGDLLGTVTHEAPTEGLTPPRLEAALVPFLGWTLQTPPTTSAKKIDGEPAYKKVHRGEAVTLPPSRVYLHQARFTAHDLPRTSELTLTCRGGYYVRALVRDLGRALGSAAHVNALRRTDIGPYADPAPGRAPVELRGEAIFPWYPSRRLTDAELGALRQGDGVAQGELEPGRWPLPAGFPEPPPRVRAFHQGRFLRLLEPQHGEFHSAIDLEPGL